MHTLRHTCATNHNLKDFYKLEDKLFDKYKINDLKPIYVANYETEILGQCTYKQYNIDRKIEESL